MAATTTGSFLLAGAPEQHADIAYATGFRALDPVVLLVQGGCRQLVVSPLEVARARETCRGIDVFMPGDLKLRRHERGRLSAWAAALCRRSKVRTVTVPPGFPHAVAVSLQRRGIRVQVAKTPIFPERAVKTSAECRYIRDAQQAAVLAMRAAIAQVAQAEPDPRGVLRLQGEPLTSERVRRTIAETAVAHDCVAERTIVAGGAQGADPHECGHGPLRAGETIVIDIFPRHSENGYWGDLTRTVLRGVAPPRLRKLYAAVRAAERAALAHVKAGVKCRTVHMAAAAELARRGYVSGIREGAPVGFTHSTGHGVGLTIHEAPAVAANDTRLRAGNVITIEPGLYYPELGSVRIEDTVVVTARGWRYLVPCEKRFVI